MMVAFWKIKMSEIKNARDFRQKLETLMRQIGWSDSPPQASTFVEVCTKLRSAQNKIRTIRKQANKHRSKFLQERAAAEALAGNQEVAQVLRRLERAEAPQSMLSTTTQISKTNHSWRHYQNRSRRTKWRINYHDNRTR
jgi:uncharacterized coiled-coil DUF342 family protein